MSRSSERPEKAGCGVSETSRRSGDQAMSEQTPSSKLPQNVTGDEDDNLTRLAAGGAGEGTQPEHGAPASIQGLSPLSRTSPIASLAAPPPEPIEEE